MMAKDPIEIDEDEEQTEKAKYTSLTPKKLVKLMVKLTEEYKELGPEAQAGLGPAIHRRHEIARELRALSALELSRQAWVHVQVPAVGEGKTHHVMAAFRIGERVFYAGRTYKLREQEAAVLLYMIDQRRRTEARRLEDVGTTADLGTIGDRAKFAEIARE